MGLHAYNPTSQQILDAFSAKLIKSSPFKSECCLMKQVSPQALHISEPTKPSMKDLWLVQVQDSQETVYLINRHGHCVMEADMAMSGIIEKKMDYRNRTTIKFEGKRYTKGDFNIRLAAATQIITGVSGQTTFLGHIMEVEYAPLHNLDIAEPAIQEIVTMLQDHIPMAMIARAGGLRPAGSLEPIKPAYDKYKSLPSQFGTMHTALLYAESAVSLLNSQQQQQQGK